MAPRTTSDVQDTLDAAMSWRRIEMATLVSAMETARKQAADSPLTRALARSCVALIYAHWEGFTKEACQCYVNFVAKRRLRFQELNDGFLKSALAALMRRSASGDDVGDAVLLDVVRRPEVARAVIPKNSIVDTKANLRYLVLCDILHATGLSVAHFETKANLIDKSLCDARNSIAHGRGMFPTADDIRELHTEVLGMMEHLKGLILDAAQEQAYRADSQSPLPARG